MLFKDYIYLKIVYNLTNKSKHAIFINIQSDKNQWKTQLSHVDCIY